MSKVFDEKTHQPVMVSEVLSLLQVKSEGCYIDCTLGGGGHAAAILEQLGPDGCLVGVDRDQEALESAQKRLSRLDRYDIFTAIHDRFSNISEWLDRVGRPLADGIIADLGVSSWQLEAPERGFGYATDGPLDMRMDATDDLTAKTLVNTWPAETIARVLREYGEERYAVQISRAIVREREKKTIQTTSELSEIIKKAMPAASRRENQHPAKRTFQALRIAVNDELGELETFLSKAPDKLADGGRICVITFHSLEDRLVKKTFRTLENPCICPRDFPVCTCGRISAGVMVTRRPISPSPDERRKNPRARSARMRCFERRVTAASHTGGSDHA